jgi:hypothetical protein
MVPNSAMPITVMKMQPPMKLRSLNNAKRTKGSFVVSEWAKK